MSQKVSHPFEIEVLATGNELLDGSITDTHSTWLANQLAPLGLRLSRISVVPDDRALISEILSEAERRSDLVIVSGGLGPTTDDLTLEVAAETFKRPMVFDSKAKANVVQRFRQVKREMTRIQSKQFYIPEGSQVLSNPTGTAPGIRLSHKRATFFFLPGVPAEYRYLAEAFVLPWVKAKVKTESRHLFIFKAFGITEGELNTAVLELKPPKDAEVGYRTHFPENHLKLLISGKTRPAARKKLHSFIRRLKTSLGSRIFAEDQETLAERVLQHLRESKRRLVTAESCTGGLAASMLTEVAGSSDCFERGFVTYSNESKMELLGVSAETLKKFGAVSEETVREMVLGALKNSRADTAIAITGIAGPSGGSKEKPVGTVWIAMADSKNLTTKLLHLPYDRKRNQVYSVYAALSQLNRDGPSPKPRT